MLAGQIAESAQVVGAAALLILAISLWTLVRRRGFKRFDAKFGKSGFSLEGMDRRLESIQATGEKINAAVNSVPEGTPTLVQRIGVLEQGHEALIDHQRWEADALCRMATRIGIPLAPPPLDRRAPSQPDPLPKENHE